MGQDIGKPTPKHLHINPVSIWFCIHFGLGTKALLVIDVQNDFISGTLAVQTSEGIVPTINNIRDKFDCASWLTRFAIFTFCIASFHFVSTFNIWLLGSRVVEIEHIRHRIWNRPRWWFHTTGILMSTAPLWKVQMLARWPWRRWGNFASVMMRTNVSQSVQPVYICSFFSPFEMLLRSAKECWPVDAVHPGEACISWLHVHRLDPNKTMSIRRLQLYSCIRRVSDHIVVVTRSMSMVQIVAVNIRWAHML